MSRLFYHVMQDNAGNLLFGVSGTMRLAGTGTLATIYGDEALTIPIANPMTNHPSFGSFKCFLGVGDYDFHMAKAGYSFETLTGVQGSGTMADQNAGAVAITGGNIAGLAALSTDALGVGAPAPATFGQTRLAGPTAVQAVPQTNMSLRVGFAKSTQTGLWVQATENDAGANANIFFANVAGTGVGSITTTAAATAYNTASDGRLKEAVEDLPAAVAVIDALHPVAFRWKADGTPGHGFIAQEVQQVLPDVVQGTSEAPDPMQVDFSKLMPWVVSALQAVLRRLEVLEAR